MLKWVLISFFLASTAFSQSEVTEPYPYETQPAQVYETEKICTPPSPPELKELLKTTGIFCSPMALAASASFMKKVAPKVATSLMPLLGRLTGRIATGANIAGATITGIQIMGLLASGASSIERCRTQEIEFKKYIIYEINERGKAFQKTLADAGISLSARDIRRLQFPPAYSEEDRINNILCADLVKVAVHMEEMQNRVYLEKTKGIMNKPPLPPYPAQKLTRRDINALQNLSQSLTCAGPKEYIQGICLIGNTVLYGRKFLKESKNNNSPTTNSNGGSHSSGEDFTTSTEKQNRAAFQDLKEQKITEVNAQIAVTSLTVGQQIRLTGNTVRINKLLASGDDHAEAEVFLAEGKDKKQYILKVFNSTDEARENTSILEDMRGYLGPHSVVKTIAIDKKKGRALFEYIPGEDLNSIISSPKVPAQTKMRLQIMYEELVSKAKRAKKLIPIEQNIIVRPGASPDDFQLIVIDAH